MHYQCLIVDDEVELAKATCEYFQMFDVTCSWVSTAAECEAFLKEHTIDVLLLDINLEQESGFTLCKKIRETSDVPILFISARQSDDDVLIALNIGGDDYIKKPYSLSILLAKVKVILKRVLAVAEKNSANDMGKTTDLPETEENKDNRNSDSIKISLIPERMTVQMGENEVQLKAKEYKLFSYLYENANRIITKDELFNAVWGDAFFSDGTLNVHIRKLREKLEENPNEPKLIETVWGTGYILKL